MKTRMLLRVVVAVGLLSGTLSVLVGSAAHAQDCGSPVVFQAAGPEASSIQGAVDAFRAALGSDNGNVAVSFPGGRREINWDGGGNNLTTTAPVTPFNVFLNARGAQFTTPGQGLSQAPPSGGPQGGLATLFRNPTYGDIFNTFSPFRLFTPVGSNITDARFFIPGTTGATPAVVSGFGAVFTDVDLPDGSGRGRSSNQRASTLVEYFDAGGKGVFSSFVPASPGDGSLSFLGVVFLTPAATPDACVARVRITTGNTIPAPDEDRSRDVVMMDDFIYGEPQTLP